MHIAYKTVVLLVFFSLTVFVFPVVSFWVIVHRNIFLSLLPIAHVIVAVFLLFVIVESPIPFDISVNCPNLRHHKLPGAWSFCSCVGSVSFWVHSCVNGQQLIPLLSFLFLRFLGCFYVPFQCRLCFFRCMVI